MGGVVLRPYQHEAIHAIRSAWAGGMRRPAIVLPTGTGKTTVFSEIIGQMAEGGIRSLILAHRDELLEQAADRVRTMLPGLRVGMVGDGREEVRNRDVIVGSVQTLGRVGSGEARVAQLVRAGVRLAIVDEAHHAVADSYMRILRALGVFEPWGAGGSYALGVTATMVRSDKLALGQVWEEIVYRYGVLDAIRAGYLVHPKGIRVRVAGLDLDRVKRRGGDMAAGDLADALHDALAPRAVTRAYLEHAQGRPTVGFSPNVALGYEFAEAMREEGIRAIAFDGTTHKVERRRILTGFKMGDHEVVWNCGVLTEGFDAPLTSCVIIARPTNSSGLYVQMAGRGLRPHPQSGKTDCLIIDVVGATTKHRLAGLADLAGIDRPDEMPEELAIYDELPDEEAVDLMDLMDPASPMRQAMAPEHPDGPLVVEIVDLMGESRAAWLRTERGVWFLESGDRIVFLAPEVEPGRYAVCTTAHKDASGAYRHRRLDLEQAMLRGEHEASAAIGTVLIKRSAAWRKGSPTSGQRARAVRLGIELESEPGVERLKGELSDLIAVVKVSARVDRMTLVASVTPDGYWPASAPSSEAA